MGAFDTEMYRIDYEINGVEQSSYGTTYTGMPLYVLDNQIGMLEGKGAKIKKVSLGPNSWDK